MNTQTEETPEETTVGALRKLIESIPDDTQIIITDYNEGMLRDCVDISYREDTKVLIIGGE